jgi:hypothetical protein
MIYYILCIPGDVLQWLTISYLSQGYTTMTYYSLCIPEGVLQWLPISYISQGIYYNDLIYIMYPGGSITMTYYILCIPWDVLQWLTISYISRGYTTMTGYLNKQGFLVVLSQIMTYQRVCSKSSTTGVPSEAGTTDPSVSPETWVQPTTLLLLVVNMLLNLVFCVVFCRLSFILLSITFGHCIVYPSSIYKFW